MINCPSSQERGLNGLKTGYFDRKHKKHKKYRFVIDVQKRNDILNLVLENLWIDC